jgi:pimeloyl-ACP methyl ester carboxylesterase
MLRAGVAVPAGFYPHRLPLLALSDEGCGKISCFSRANHILALSFCSGHGIEFAVRHRHQGAFMKRALKIFPLAASALFCLLFFTASARADEFDNSIVSRIADVGGIKLHYLVAGRGTPLILLHGYAETSRMWRPIMPVLARKFMVIAPDLPGFGDSEIPLEGLDMKTAAIRMHGIAASLGVSRAEVVGHDIGLMVAYAYAAQFPAEVTKLALMDAFLPGVPGWEAIYNNPNLWHFRFNGPTPEALVQGRERDYFEYFWNELAADKNHSLPAADREAYIASYSRPGRMHAGWAYFVSFQQAAKDFAEFSKTKLNIPVLVIGGDKASGQVLSEQANLVATDVTVVILKDTGHWVMEERPEETTDALMKFL